jgi:hypothetical protein
VTIDLNVAAIDTRGVDQRTAAAIEAAEARAWADLYAAAPAQFAATAGLGSLEVAGALLLHWAATGRRYFSRVIGLGVAAPATEAALDEVLAIYAQLGICRFLLQSLPQCRPAVYDEWLHHRGLEPFDAQDRIVRGGEPLEGAVAAGGDDGLAVEPVRTGTADEWAEFLQRAYGLDTGRWLQELIGRPGWHQYIARSADAKIVGARGMFVGPDGIAWLGMDGPVPGVMTDAYGPDAAICEYMVADGLARGARGFVADIEAPSESFDTPAYEYFPRLGFRRPYARTHYARL